MHLNGGRDFQNVADDEWPCHLVRMETELNCGRGKNSCENELLFRHQKDSMEVEYTETVRQIWTAMWQFPPNNVTRLKYSKILLTQHLVIWKYCYSSTCEGWSQEWKSSFLPVRSFISETGLQESLYINHCGMSWPLVCYSITFFSYEDS